jgi:hypothetical protein
LLNYISFVLISNPPSPYYNRLKNEIVTQFFVQQWNEL